MKDRKVPEICRFYGIVIRMFFNEHNPPHFHAQYGEYIAQVKIDDGEIIEGYLPQRAISLIQNWVQLHRNELFENWSNCQQNKKSFKIEPLD